MVSKGKVSVFKMGWLVTSLMTGCGGVPRCAGGELTIAGDLLVKSNQTVQGQLSGGMLVASNISVTGTAVLQNASITCLMPQGDLSMGPYTNHPAGGN